MASAPPTPAAPVEGEESAYVEDGEANVSPEEQAQYEEFVANSYELMHTENGPPAELLQALKAGDGEATEAGNPRILALGQTAVTIITKLDDSAREAGNPLTDDVLLHGAVSVIEELAEIAEAANIHDYSEEDLTGALQTVIDIYRPKLIADGRTTEEELKAMFDEINTADQAGTLGEMLPGMGQVQ